MHSYVPSVSYAYILFLQYLNFNLKSILFFKKKLQNSDCFRLLRLVNNLIDLLKDVDKENRKRYNQTRSLPSIRFGLFMLVWLNGRAHHS